MTKFKVGDRVNDSGTWGKIIEVIKKNARGEVIYGFAPESGPGKGFAYEILESKLSKNSVVANALSVVNNMKFKVGDYVEVIGSGLASKGLVGRVWKIDPKNKRWPYKVNFGAGKSDGEFSENELAKAYNSTAKNALGVAKNVTPRMWNIVAKQLDNHARDFVRFELEKIASQLRKAYDDIYKRWMQTSIAQGYVRAGGKPQDAENAIDDYMIRLSSAWNNLEHL